MPQKVLKFTGINRMVNEFQNSGACDELINLRPSNSGCRVIKQKKLLRTGSQYDLIYEHSFGNTQNIIVSHGGNLWWSTGDLNVLYAFSPSATVDKDTVISSAGNVLVVYNSKTKTQYVYRYKNDSYELYDAKINLPINMSVSFRQVASAKYETFIGKAEDGVSKGEAFNAFIKNQSGFYSEYPHGLCGAIVVGCTYVLSDGSEVWSTAFTTIDATKQSWFKNPEIQFSGTGVQGGEYNAVTYGAGGVVLVFEGIDTSQKEVKEIRVYSTRPVSLFECTKNIDTSTGIPIPIIDKVQIDDTNLAGQIMYYQGSIPLNKRSYPLLLNFGIEQAGNDIMPVNAGCIERVGEVFSYNNRFHYYNSTVSHVLQYPTTSIDEIKDAPEWIAYVKINDEWKLIPNKTYQFGPDVANDFIYPMGDIKQLAFVKGSSGSSFTVPYEEMFYVDLINSSAYNYSYAFDTKPSVQPCGDFYSIVSATGQLWGNSIDRAVFLKDEPNVMNVSEPFNPFAFPVKYSYSLGGKIIDIVTSYLPISSTRTDQSPLTIFTSNGIYSIGQGDGTTLYGNISPLQPQVIDGRAMPTPYGTFFVSSKNLYMLIGRETVSVSQAVGGERELSIREQDVYQNLCCSRKSSIHNFSSLLSNEDFDDFISDSSMLYDQFKNELIISSNNADIKYSYVFNLDTKAFHKIGKKYIGSQNGTRFAIEVNGDETNIVDLHIEIDSKETPILLQSRPLSLETFHTHIQRLIMLVDTKLTDNQYLLVSVFGSDNLYDWKCIVSSQKHDTVLRQIRTNRAAKSYRDYIILINGTVSTDTDLSEIIADYTVVSRRLG